MSWEFEVLPDTCYYIIQPLFMVVWLVEWNKIVSTGVYQRKQVKTANQIRNELTIQLIVDSSMFSQTSFGFARNDSNRVYTTPRIPYPGYQRHLLLMWCDASGRPSETRNRAWKAWLAPRVRIPQNSLDFKFFFQGTGKQLVSQLLENQFCLFWVLGPGILIHILYSRKLLEFCSTNPVDGLTNEWKLSSTLTKIQALLNKNQITCNSWQSNKCVNLKTYQLLSSLVLV